MNTKELFLYELYSSHTTPRKVYMVIYAKSLSRKMRSLHEGGTSTAVIASSGTWAFFQKID
jgi:hypothetical protein